MLKSRPDSGRPQQQQQQQDRQPLQSTASEPRQKQPSDVSPYIRMPAPSDVRQKSSSRPGRSHGGGNHHRGHTSGCSSNSSRTGGNKQTKYKRFSLHSPDDKSLNSVIEYVSLGSLNRFRTCVVTIISKDPINDSMRDHLVQTILASGGSPHGKTSKRHSGSDPDERNQATCEQQNEDREENEYEVQVVGHADFDNGLVVLTLDSFVNTNKMINLKESMPDNFQKRHKESVETSSNPLLDVWPKWNQNLIKTLLILFTMSHVIVFYNPEPSIDYNLIQTLKVLEALRMKSLSRICDLLETIASGQIFSQQWIRNCRISCPRALFICNTSYFEFEIGGNLRMAQVRDELEEQIYLLMKKSGLITGTSQINQKSLFCLTDQDDFVFIISQKDLNLLGVSNRQQVGAQNSSSVDVKRINNCTSQQTLESASMYESQEALNAPMKELKIEDITKREEMKSDQTIEFQAQSINHRHGRLRRFINKHISDVRTAAIQDHDNKQGSKQHSATILPRFDDYFNVLLRLKCLLFPAPLLDEQTTNDQRLESTPSWTARDERRFVDIYDLLDTDNLFSQRHCYKARLAAFELYARGLEVTPRDESSHRNSLSTAIQYYNNQARGSAHSTNLRFLEDECNRHWLEVGPSSRGSNPRDRSSKSGSGRSVARTISADSATVRSPAHKNQSGFEKEKDNTLCITRRPNGVIVTAGCECGRESSLLIKPNDRKRKLERVDIYRIND